MQCQVCGEPAEHKCGGCHDALYCSQECQVKDWIEGGHAEVCGIVDRAKGVLRKLRNLSHEQMAVAHTKSIMYRIESRNSIDAQGKIQENIVSWQAAWPSKGTVTFTIRCQNMDFKRRNNRVVSAMQRENVYKGTYSEVWTDLLKEHNQGQQMYHQNPSPSNRMLSVAIDGRINRFLRIFAADMNARSDQTEALVRKWTTHSDCERQFSLAFRKDSARAGPKKQACITAARDFGAMLDKIQSRRKRR